MMPQGILKLCKLVNTANKGKMPVYQLQQTATYFYSERELGITRSHFARQDGITIDLLVRCHIAKASDFTVDEYVVLDDGITQMQITDINNLPDITAVDLTLKKVNDNYNVIFNQNN